MTPNGDRSKCRGETQTQVCPLRESCTRYLSPAHPERQWWTYMPDGECKEYKPVEVEPWWCNTCDGHETIGKRSDDTPRGLIQITCPYCKGTGKRQEAQSENH